MEWVEFVQKTLSWEIRGHHQNHRGTAWNAISLWTARTTLSFWLHSRKILIVDSPPVHKSGRASPKKTRPHTPSHNLKPCLIECPHQKRIAGLESSSSKRHQTILIPDQKTPKEPPNIPFSNIFPPRTCSRRPSNPKSLLTPYCRSTYSRQSQYF